MKNTQNTTKKHGLSITIPSPILEGSGIAEAKCAELHQLRHCVAVLQGKMTAYELIETIESLSGLVESLTAHLNDVCGICGGCDACNDTLEGEQEIKIPPALLDELDIPRDAKLEAYADTDESLILVGRANYEHDISDVPDDLLEMLVTAGVCVSELEEHLMEDDVIYGE